MFCLRVQRQLGDSLRKLGPTEFPRRTPQARTCQDAFDFALPLALPLALAFVASVFLYRSNAGFSSSFMGPCLCEHSPAVFRQASRWKSKHVAFPFPLPPFGEGGPGEPDLLLAFGPPFLPPPFACDLVSCEKPVITARATFRRGEVLAHSFAVHQGTRRPGGSADALTRGHVSDPVDK